MKINPINNNQTNFQAVNQAYLKTAKELASKSITRDINPMLVQDVFMDAVEKRMSKMDAIDTLAAIKKLNICEDTKDFIVDIQTQLGKLAILDELCAPFTKK